MTVMSKSGCKSQIKKLLILGISGVTNGALFVSYQSEAAVEATHSFLPPNAPCKAPKGGKLLSVWLFGADSEHNVHILNQYVHWFAKMPQIRGKTARQINVLRPGPSS